MLRRLSDASITNLINNIVEPFKKDEPNVNLPGVIGHKHYLGGFSVSAFAYVPVLFRYNQTYQMVLLYVTEDIYDYSIVTLEDLNGNNIQAKILLFVSQIELAEKQKQDLSEGFYKEIQGIIEREFSDVC